METLCITLTDRYINTWFNPGCLFLKRRAREHFCYSDTMRADVIYDRSCRWSRPGLHHAALAVVQHVYDLYSSHGYHYLHHFLSLSLSFSLSNLVCPSALCHCNLSLFSTRSSPLSPGAHPLWLICFLLVTVREPNHLLICNETSSVNDRRHRRGVDLSGESAV